MAKKRGHDPTVANRIKFGKPRGMKKKKGNAPPRTSKSGNGSRIR